MATPEAVRVGLQVDTPHLAEQVTRVVEAAGGLLVADAPVDLLIVEDGRSLSGAASPATQPVRVRLGTGARPAAVGFSPQDGDVLELPADAETLLRYIGAWGLRPRARTVGFLGARGGAGASTLAAAVAREAVRAGASTALADLDGAGGGVDLLLGIEHEPGPRWADLRAERAGFPAHALSMALPRWEGVRVLSADGRGGAHCTDPGVGDALHALASEHDLLVLDLPRNGPWGLERREPEARALPGALLLLVALCDVRSAAACSRAARALEGEDLGLVVRLPGPGGLDPEEFAEACGLPLVAVTRTERGGPAAAERGETPGDRRRSGVARTATRLVTALGIGS